MEAREAAVIEYGSVVSGPVSTRTAVNGVPVSDPPQRIYTEGAQRSNVKRNVGRLDAFARVIGGVAIAVLAFFAATGGVSVPVVSALGLGVAGAVLIVEGATRRCLLYRVLGIDRCPVD